jgi:hypothetical protein
MKRSSVLDSRPVDLVTVPLMDLQIRGMAITWQTGPSHYWQISDAGTVQSAGSKWDLISWNTFGMLPCRKG